MLVQTIFLSSTLAYADETLVNNTGSDANGGFIATQIENESTDEEDIQNPQITTLMLNRSMQRPLS